MARVFKLGCPPIGDGFVALFLSIDEERRAQFQSAHQAQLAIAREVLDAGIWVSATERFDQLLVLLREDRLSQMQSRLHALKLRTLRVTAADASLVEACFRFSVSQRVAPEFNRVGDSLIQGTDFLTDTARRKFRSISIETFCDGNGQLFVSLTAQVVKLYPLEPWQIAADTHGAAPPQQRWCFLLPKLSRGQVVGARRELPPVGQFGSYDALRDYWLQAYGYTLPETAPECYYDVIFRNVSRAVFTYPSCCALSSLPAPLLSEQKVRDAAVVYLLQVLLRKLSAPGGQRLTVSLVDVASPSTALSLQPAVERKRQRAEHQAAGKENVDPRAALVKRNKYV